MKSRLTWVDIARGFGIIAVLYGHAISGDSYRHLLYAFHMPLFFFLSGMVFSPKKYTEFFPFVRKNIITILFPYFLFALLSYLIWLSARTSLPPITDTLQHFRNVVYGNSNGLFFNVVLWFLPCLFVTKMLFWIITKISLHPTFILAALTVFSVGGYLLSILFPGIKLPFGIETAITATVFFGAGYLWTTHADQASQILKKYAVLLTIVFSVIMVALASINFDIYGYQIDMRLNRYSNYFLFYGASLSGILGTLALSMRIQSNKILEYIGKHSLQLFVWHIIVFTYFTRFTRIFINPETFSDLRNVFIAPIFTVCAIIVILFAMRIFNKTFLLLTLKAKR